MKVINHNQGNYHFCDSDSAVMYGTIEMTRDEWIGVYYYLRTLYFQLSQNEHNNDDYYTKISLEAHGQPLDVAAGKHFSLGVSPTRRIFEAFSLPRYKHQNYSIVITD